MIEKHIIQIIKVTSILLLIVLCGTQISLAVNRCDCSYDKWKGDCEATITKSGDWIKIKVLTTNNCARVDWYADQHPDYPHIRLDRAAEFLLGDRI